jgi:hypothetical protein
MAWRWNGGPAVLQSRATDDTGYVQPIKAAANSRLRVDMLNLPILNNAPVRDPIEMVECLVATLWASIIPQFQGLGSR